jgi:hypothetical protein
MKKFALILLLVIGLSVSTTSQAQVAVGLRAGLPTGVSLKLNPTKSRAIELIAGSYGRGNINITGLYEFQKQIGDVDGLTFYAGPGLHFNYFNDIYYYYYRNYKSRYDVDYGRGGYATAGVDGVFGIEYKIPDFPMSVGADLKPAIDIGRYTTVFYMDAALNIRFYL